MSVMSRVHRMVKCMSGDYEIKPNQSAEILIPGGREGLV